MSTTSSIEWTDTTWNPTTGCDRVSDGCTNCYALTMAKRLKAIGQPNVWLGVSVEDQKWAEMRIPALLHTPAAVRFVSCEPLLGPVDLQRAVFADALPDDAGPAAA